MIEPINILKSDWWVQTASIIIILWRNEMADCLINHVAVLDVIAIASSDSPIVFQCHQQYPLEACTRSQHSLQRKFISRYHIIFMATVTTFNCSKSKRRSFLGAFVTIASLRLPALTARKHTCGSLRLQLHKPHVAISRPHDSHSQFSVVVTHYILIAAHFTYPGELESWVVIVCSGDWTTSCMHEWTCVGAANDLTNWASQTVVLLYIQRCVSFIDTIH